MDMLFRNRKFKFAVVTWLMGNFWLWIGLIDGTSYTNLMFAVLGCYAAGSVGEQYLKGKKL